MFNTEKTDGIAAGPVVWQSKNTQVAQGGFTLEDLFSAGTLVQAGTPIGYDESTRMAKVLKCGVAQANATSSATTYKVLKGHVLAVGMDVKTGSTANKSITAIDMTNEEYDVITLDATLGAAVTVGDAIFVDDLGSTMIKGLLYQPIVIGANGLASVSVALRGTIYERRICPIPVAYKEKLPLIIFSQSF